MTDINDLPDSVFIKVLEAKGLPTEFDPDSAVLPTADVIANMKAALATSRRQWKAMLVDLPYETIKAVREVHVTRSGRIRLDAIDRSTTVNMTLSGRTVGTDWIKKRLPAFLTVVVSAGYVYLKTSDQAGSVRIKAFEQWKTDAYVESVRIRKSDTDAYSISSLQDLFTPVTALSDKDNMIRLARKAIGRQASMEKEVKRHDSTPQFTAFMDKKRVQMQQVAAANKGVKTIDALTIPVRKTKASRTWGIEVESGGARYAETPKGWGRKRDGSLRSAYRGYNTEPETYTIPVEYCDNNHVNTDRSDYIDPDICNSHGEFNFSALRVQGDDTAEFVSPILKTFHSNGLRQLTKQLAREPQNDSAGVHVHVGADGLTPKQLGALVYAYQIIEPLITESYSRNVRDYCRERDTRQVLSVVRSAKTAENVTTGLEHGDRYHSVNLQALYSHGTVEFRSMGPVYNYEHLIRWAYFCREMVNLAGNNVPAKVWASVKGWSDVEAIFAKYGTETPDFIIDSMEAKLSKAEELELV